MNFTTHHIIKHFYSTAKPTKDPIQISALFNDPTRDSIANNFVIGVYCRCLKILYQIIFFYKI